MWANHLGVYRAKCPFRLGIRNSDLAISCRDLSVVLILSPLLRRHGSESSLLRHVAADRNYCNYEKHQNKDKTGVIQAVPLILFSSSRLEAPYGREGSFC